MAPFRIARRRPLAVLAILLAIAPGCSDSQQDLANIRIDGSSTVFPISEAVAEAFREVHPDVQVPVSQNGTSAGMGKFLLAESDICDASRPITEDERKRAAAAGIDFIELTVAFDGLAIVVNPQNSWCDSITVDELKAMWRPEASEVVQSWSQVNEQWPNVPLKLFGAGTASGTFDFFTEVVCGKAKSSRSDYTASENDNMLVRGVAGEKGGLAYFGYAYYAENQDKLKLLAVDSGNGPVKPSLESVRDGSYTPLSRPLLIYVNKASLKRPEVATFVKFYLAYAAELAEDVGYVPVTDDVDERNRAVLDAALGN